MAPPTTRASRKLHWEVSEVNILAEDRVKDLTALNKRLVQENSGLIANEKKLREDKEYFEQQLYSVREEFWKLRDDFEASQKSNMYHKRDAQRVKEECADRYREIKRLEGEIGELRGQLASGIWVFGRRVYSGKPAPAKPRVVPGSFEQAFRDPLV